MVEIRAMVVAVSLWAAAVCSSGTVTLRGSATVTGSVVRLSDVARLEGEEAERLADVVVVDDLAREGGRDGFARVEISRVRRALEASGAKLGRVALQGSVCEIRVGGVGGGTEGGGELAARAQAPSATGGNVRGAVESMLCRLYGVEGADLRVTFDARDWDFLGQEVWGKRVEAQPGGGATGTKMGVRVWVYEGDRVAQEGQVTASVEIRRRVAVMTRAVRRGELILEGDVRMEEMWVEGASAAVAARGPDEVVGREARTRLSVGSVVRSGDVESAQVIRRGDLVVVHCVSGGVVVKAPARALGDARDGESVELKLEGADRPFVARASGKGRAVVEIGGVTTIGGVREGQ